uniref:PB1-like domain-containing protein n=1 Tax=Tanacetum cinerariifolium TaxID=118510 RepID=A0A6L2JGP3_TANCI|nr:hypothetical protein [Tanacetum cinerariifolium]
MVLEDQTGWKPRRRKWINTTERLIEDLESAYENAPNMFSIRIHHGGKFQRYPGRMYADGHVDIFDMVDIDPFTVVALMMLIGVQGVDTQDHVLPIIQSQFSDTNLSFVSQQATASQVIKDVMTQLSFEETKLDGEAGFGDVTRSDIESSRLSHYESFGVDDLDLNLNEPTNLNVSQIETQYELPLSKEPYASQTFGFELVLDVNLNTLRSSTKHNLFLSSCNLYHLVHL